MENSLDNLDYMNMSLINAMNNNDWTSIYNLAGEIGLNRLKSFTTIFLDKLIPNIVSWNKNFVDKLNDELLELNNWINCNKDRINNKYVFSLIESLLLEEDLWLGTERQLKRMEELINKYPERWETYLVIANYETVNETRKYELLETIQSISPNREIYFWLNAQLVKDIKFKIEYLEKGYSIKKNMVFLKEITENYKSIGEIEKSNEYLEKIQEIEKKNINIKKKYKKSIKPYTKENRIDTGSIFIGVLLITFAIFEYSTFYFTNKFLVPFQQTEMLRTLFQSGIFPIVIGLLGIKQIYNGFKEYINSFNEK